jgi:hypothetical protein
MKLYKKIALTLFMFICTCVRAYDYNLVVCAIFQNDATDLKEWIEFHKLVGVEHFYLYNNLSEDDYLSILQPYIDSGEVDLIQWDYPTRSGVQQWGSIQIKAYNHALSQIKKKVKWAAFIDTDEFLFPVEVDNLSEFLNDFDKYGAVCVNWQLYGTSNIAKIAPNHLLIEDLCYKAEADFKMNRAIKSIIRPERVAKFHTMHECVFLPKYRQVNPNQVYFKGRFTDVNIDKLRINHYWTRDEDYLFNVKIPRYRKWGRSEDYVLERASHLNQVLDTSIHKYVPELRKKMGLL